MGSDRNRAEGEGQCASAHSSGCEVGSITVRDTERQPQTTARGLGLPRYEVLSYMTPQHVSDIAKPQHVDFAALVVGLCT